MLLANFNGKEHLRHCAVSLRQHGFLVLSDCCMLRTKCKTSCGAKHEHNASNMMLSAVEFGPFPHLRPQPTRRTSWKLVANSGWQPGFPTSFQLVRLVGYGLYSDRYRCRNAAAAPIPHKSSASTFWQWKSCVCIRFLEEQEKFM